MKNRSTTKLSRDVDHVGREEEGFLSPQLRAQFDAIHAIIQAKKRLYEWGLDDEIDSDGGRLIKKCRKFDDANFVDTVGGGNGSEDESIDWDEIKLKLFELGWATVTAAESEISLLKYRIDKMESLLLHSSPRDHHPSRAEEVMFPSLPFTMEEGRNH